MTATPGAPVTMFTTSWCGYCVRLKKLMQREGHRVRRGRHRDTTTTAADVVMQANGGNRTVPTLLFADGTALTNPSIDAGEGAARISRRRHERAVIPGPRPS